MKVNIGPYPKGSGKRKVNVKIDGQDIWNMDHTLAMIIHPMLVMLRDGKKGSPGTDDSDVPLKLRSTSAPPTKNSWDCDANWHKRWQWIIEEMTWTFEQLSGETDWEDQYYDFMSLTHVWVDITEKKMKDPTAKLFKRAKLTKKMRKAANYEHMPFIATHQQKINNGLRLFGKYYRALWT